MILTILSWTAVVAVLGAYASRRRKLYDVTNLVCCVPVALPAILAGAWSSAAISLAFGLIGGMAWLEQQPQVHFRIRDLREGLQSHYPLCCVLRLLMDSFNTDGAVKRGIVERLDGSRFVPCNIFHRGTPFAHVCARDCEVCE